MPEPIVIDRFEARGYINRGVYGGCVYAIGFAASELVRIGQTTAVASQVKVLRGMLGGVKSIHLWRFEREVDAGAATRVVQNLFSDRRRGGIWFERPDLEFVTPRLLEQGFALQLSPIPKPLFTGLDAGQPADR